jgi:hypothetical protein
LTRGKKLPVEDEAGLGDLHSSGHNGNIEKVAQNNNFLRVEFHNYLFTGRSLVGRRSGMAHVKLLNHLAPTNLYYRSSAIGTVFPFGNLTISRNLPELSLSA